MPGLRAALFALALLPGLALAQPTARDDDALDDLASLLDEPVQTASTYTQRSSEAPASVTVVSAEEIDRAGHRTLADVLSTVRGFYVSDDRNYAYVGVRGLSRPSDYNNRIAVLVDGVPVRDGVLGTASIGADLGIPLSAVERVEVVRGPGSTLYGTGAMFAVLNVVLKDSRTLAGVRGLGSLVGPHGYSAEGIAAAPLGAHGEVSVAAYGSSDDGSALYFPEYDRPETFGGRAVGLDWERARGALASVRYGPAGLDLRLSERDKGIPTGSFETVFGAESWTRDRSASATLRVEEALSPALSVFALGSAHHHYYYGLYPYDDGDGPYDTYDDSNATGLRAEGRVQWDASAAHRVVAGLEATSNVQSRYRLYDDEAVYLAVDAPFTSTAAFAQVESQLAADLALTAGARLDRVREESAVSPRGALVYTPNARTSLKLIAGSAFRAPSTYELAYEDPFSGQIPAAALAPERVTTAEAIVSREVAAGVRVEGTAFATRVTGLIDTREVDEATGDLQFVNVGRAEVVGAEAGLVGVRGGWRTRASYGLQRARDPDLGQALSNAPVHVGKLTAFGPLGRRLWASVGARAESGRWTVYDAQTDPYAVVDVALSADVMGETGRVTLGLRNALDADYALPGGFEHRQTAIPQRPRSAYLRLDVRL